MPTVEDVMKLPAAKGWEEFETNLADFWPALPVGYSAIGMHRRLELALCEMEPRFKEAGMILGVTIFHHRA